MASGESGPTEQEVRRAAAHYAAQPPDSISVTELISTATKLDIPASRLLAQTRLYRV